MYFSKGFDDSKSQYDIICDDEEPSSDSGILDLVKKMKKIQKKKKKKAMYQQLKD